MKSNYYKKYKLPFLYSCKCISGSKRVRKYPNNMHKAQYSTDLSSFSQVLHFLQKQTALPISLHSYIKRVTIYEIKQEEVHVVSYYGSTAFTYISTVLQLPKFKQISPATPKNVIK